jgi:CheY-like chemotaxis protein
LTGGIAHDFNNLLGIIKGNLELAQRRLPSDDRSMLYLADGVDAVDRAAALTHRLLAFARQQPLQQRPSNLADIISGMEDLLRRTISENIGLDVVLEAGGGTVLIDPRQLENALLNLVLNARDAMPNGGNLRIETSTVSITGTEPDLEAEVEPGLYQVISVRDSGVGMPQDDLRKAFDPFFTTKPFGMGSGLGLSMLHGFVRQSGGHVAMESEVGLGTVVRMYLPSSETPMGSTAVSQHQPDGQFPVGRGRTVLVVEDDSELRNIAAEVMQSFEFEVLKAQDGEAARNIFDQGTSVDLLFTDIVLPGPINGQELADLAREKFPELKVLMCSGYLREGLSADRAVDSGIDFISKPYGIQDLASAVERVLQHD